MIINELLQLEKNDCFGEDDCVRKSCVPYSDTVPTSIEICNDSKKRSPRSLITDTMDYFSNFMFSMFSESEDGS